MNPDFQLPLPRQWPSRVKAAILNVVSLAQHSMTCVRGWCVNGTPLVRARLAGELDQAKVAGDRGVRLELLVSHHHGRGHLPIVRLRAVS